MSGGGATASASFDPRPLTEPVDRNAVASFGRELQRTGRSPRFGGAGGVVLVIIGVIALILFGSIFLSLMGVILAGVVSSVEGGAGLTVLIALVPFFIVAGVIAAIVFAVRRGLAAERERWYRLDRFARMNGMTYLPYLGTVPLPGMIFGIGDDRMAKDLVRGDRPRFVEFGNYSYSTGSGKNRTTHEWGYVAVKLDVPLPHIVLDATGNNSLFGSNLPLQFDRDQRLGLEGDFDEYFTLSCPAGYERDALYLFTPDIMARFIDNAAALDVEIVDDWLFLYGKRSISTLDPATWAWLFSVVGALLDKLAQWARWRDERLRAESAAVTDAGGPTSALPHAGEPDAAAVTAARVPFAAPAGLLRPPPGVAPPGRRLRRGVPWASIIIGGIVVLFWLFSQLGGFGWLLGSLLGR